MDCQHCLEVANVSVEAWNFQSKERLVRYYCHIIIDNNYFLLLYSIVHSSLNANNLSLNPDTE